MMIKEVEEDEKNQERVYLSGLCVCVWEEKLKATYDRDTLSVFAH